MAVVTGSAAIVVGALAGSEWVNPNREVTAAVRVPKDENGGDEGGETAGADETEAPAGDA